MSALNISNNATGALKYLPKYKNICVYNFNNHISI